MTPARRAALLRLLQDAEAGLATAASCLPGCWAELCTAGLIKNIRADLWTLTPDGLAAARAIKDQTP